MRITSFGASAGPGPLHCVVLEIDDGVVVGREARIIAPGPLRPGRRGNLLSSGYDLLSGHSARTVDTAAVAVGSRRELLSVRLGCRGAARAVGAVPDVDAVLRALDEQAVAARYPGALVADIGQAGVRVFSGGDGAVLAARRGRGARTSLEVIRAAVTAAPRPPDAVVLVGGGASAAGADGALAALAREHGFAVVGVDEPEAVAATGAALLAADGFPARA